MNDKQIIARTGPQLLITEYGYPLQQKGRYTELYVVTNPELGVKLLI
jgi:hypothetical protein